MKFYSSKFRGSTVVERIQNKYFMLSSVELSHKLSFTKWHRSSSISGCIAQVYLGRAGQLISILFFESVLPPYKSFPALVIPIEDRLLTQQIALTVI